VDVQEIPEQRLEDRLPLPAAARRERTHRGAVVGAVLGDDLVLAGVAPVDVVLAGDLHGGLGRLRSPRDELDGAEARRREVQQHLGQLHRLRVGAVERRRERQGVQLLGDGIDDGAVAVPKADGEHAGQAVDVLAAVGGLDPNAVGLGHDEGVLGELLHLHEVEDEAHDVIAGWRVDHREPSLARLVE